MTVHQGSESPLAGISETGVLYLIPPVACSLVVNSVELDPHVADQLRKASLWVLHAAASGSQIRAVAVVLAYP